MNNYVVRQPIKDRDGNVVGNELLFHHGEDTLYNSSKDAMAADTISNFFLQNNEKIYDGKLIFITFTPSLLFRNTPKIFESDKLIIQIEDNVMVNPLSQMIIKKYRASGYQFAINDFQFASRYFSMLEFVEYIKINLKDYKEANGKNSLSDIVRTAHGFHKKCIVCGIDSKEEYELAMELQFDYLEGTYISDSTLIKTSKVEFLQGNFFQLVVAVTKDEPDMAEIEEIVSRDAYLSYALLKLVNSKYFALRKPLASIRQALVILGIGQLKQWVYLLSFHKDEDEAEKSASEQILKVSFLRGTFCASLSKYIKDFIIAPNEAYMMGIFSTLDYMVDAPLEEILQEIPILEEIREAILHKTGICGKLYELVLCYEKADWKNITKLVKELEIPENMVAQVYFDCVEDVNNTWKNITNAYHEDSEANEDQKGDEGNKDEADEGNEIVKMKTPQ